MTIHEPTDEPHAHLSANPVDTGERHWAQLDENGTVDNVIVCDSEEMAVQLGYPVELTGTEVGIGWTTTDGGATWSDTRSDDTEARRILRSRSIRTP